MKTFKKVSLYIISTIVLVIVSYFCISLVTPNVSVWIAKTVVFDVPPVLNGLPDQEARVQRIEVIKNQTYDSKYQKNTYDIFLPKDAHEKTPTIIWAHGGGFVGGNKEMITLYGEALASEGYIVVAMNYVLAPKGMYPEPIHQVQEVVDALKQSSYPIDFKQLIFAGDSAGAHIVEQYALKQTNPEFRKAAQMTEDPDISIKGLLIYSGVHSIKDMVRTNTRALDFFAGQMLWSYTKDKQWVNNEVAHLNDNAAWVTDAFPPFYITDGNTNSFEVAAKYFALVGESNNVYVQQRYFDRQVYETIHEFQFDLASEPGVTVYKDTIDFLEKVTKTIKKSKFPSINSRVRSLHDISAFALLLDDALLK